MEKLVATLRGRTIVFIDAANLEHSVRDMWVNPKDIPDNLKKHTQNELDWHVDYLKLKDFFQGICDLQDVRYYAADFGTTSHGKFLTFLKRGLTFILNTKPLKKYEDHTDDKPHRKANFDVEIAVDTMEIVNDFDTYVLFSGDCDFEYLLKKLRGLNKRVIVFSRIGHIAKELPPASNAYFDIADYRHQILKVDLKKDAKNPAKNAGSCS